MKTSYDTFCEAYDKWSDDCLEEYNSKFGESRTLHTAPEHGDYEPGDLVEFAEDGTAYPHGIGGTNYIKNAVTRWDDSPHYIE